jgi:hypothetical protein
MRFPIHCDRLPNAPQHAVGIPHDVVVPKPQNAPTRSLQKRVSPDIGWIVGVLTAVDLNDQGMRGAREIDNEGTNWNLAAKLDAAQTAVAQQTPHDALRVGLIPAE